MVIQRADIVKKSHKLGFGALTRNSPTPVLGSALLKHWFSKVESDAAIQEVRDMRVAMLLKSDDLKDFTYYESPIEFYRPDELDWRWTDQTMTGLQGIRRSDGFIKFRWYPNQTHLFERFAIPEDAFAFRLNVKPLPVAEVVEFVTRYLDNTR